MESELFRGNKRGAFTGAVADKDGGLFEKADNGTIFLDEIGDMPREMQSQSSSGCPGGRDQVRG
jgi:transcriptional regulator with PAS, ATPase and Fis domain